MVLIRIFDIEMAAKAIFSNMNKKYKKLQYCISLICGSVYMEFGVLPLRCI